MKLNMKFKMTPLVIFLILLVVLVISMFIGRSLREGLSDSMITKKVDIYSTTKDLYVLHENMLFDRDNGNLVEIQGTDASGNAIEGDIFITPRSGSVTYFTDGTDVSGNNSVTMGTISASHASWEYPSQTTNMGNKKVYYIGWDEQTYLMIYDKDENKFVGAYLFDGTNKQSADNTEIPVLLTHYHAIKNPSNNTLVSEPMYSDKRNVYQIAENVKFDFKTADLIVKSGPSEIKIYRRNEGLITTDADVIKQRTNVIMSEFTPMYAFDELGQNVIVYLPYKQKTMVVLLGYDCSTSDKLSLKSVTKFFETGTEGPGGKTILVSKSANEEEEEEEKKEEKEITPDVTSEDYILKTQIVPPVCPTCPSCPKEVTCTNCGGQGGSGTMGADGKSLVKEDTRQQNEATLRKAAVDTVGGVGEVASGAVGGVSNVAGQAVGGVGEVAGKTVGVVGDVAGKTIGTADSLIRDTAGAATGLVRDSASGIAGLFRTRPTDVKEKEENKNIIPGMQTGLGTRTQNTALPSQNHRTAEFDYMGAVPRKKPSQYMPITADFSAFAK